MSLHVVEDDDDSLSQWLTEILLPVFLLKFPRPGQICRVDFCRRWVHPKGSSWFDVAIMGRKTAPYTDSVWGSIFQQGKISFCLRKSLVQDEDLVTYFSALIDVHRWWTWIFKKLYTFFLGNFFLWPQRGNAALEITVMLVPQTHILQVAIKDPLKIY